MIGSIELPEQLSVLCNNYQVEEEFEGESPTEVFRLTRNSDTLYLKIGHKKFSNTTYSIAREKDVMLWLSQRLRAPKVLDYLENDEYQFLLMNKLDGEFLFEKKETNPYEFVDIFAEAVKQVQAISAADCPFDSSLDIRLSELKYLIDNDLAACDDFVTSGLPFNHPEELYQNLLATRFAECKLFSHGDMSDRNIVIDSRGNIGFIDWGRGGCADVWGDIAHAARNIRDETGEEKLVQRFFEKLQVAEDKQKIQYHLWLDVLF